MSNNKFWMYDVTQLFSSFDLLPNPEDSLAAKLNSIMRLTILLCAIIAVYKPVIALSTLVAVMAITTSVFSASSKQPLNEGFQEIPRAVEQDRRLACSTAQCPITQTEQNDSAMSLLEFMKEYRNVGRRNPPLYKSGFSTTQKRFCNDEVSLNYGPDFFSINQSLAGEPSMKTTIPPIIAAPSHDLSFWKENDFVTHSGINRETNFDYSRAGYNHGLLPAKCSVCMDVIGFTTTLRATPVGCYCNKEQKKKLQKPEPIVKPTKPMNNTGQNKEIHPTLSSSNFQGDRPPTRRMDGGEAHLLTTKDREKLPELIREMRRNNISENEIQNMLDAKNAADIKSTNDKKSISKSKENSADGDDSYRFIPYFESPRRDNLITQTLQPGVYQKSHVGEPIQSNIGISFTQEFVPTEIDSTSNRIKYTQQDPKNLIVTPTLREEVIEQSVENIYDPRFNGYGTSYRSYVDKLTGRPQFYYDDIDSITMPNYITRSNIDTFPWANTYGPDKITDTNDEYRQLANNAFHDSAIQFRTELQERLMRKRNAELWQRRVAPITTMKK